MDETIVSLKDQNDRFGKENSNLNGRLSLTKENLEKKLEASNAKATKLQKDLKQSQDESNELKNKLNSETERFNEQKGKPKWSCR